MLGTGFAGPNPKLDCACWVAPFLSSPFPLSYFIMAATSTSNIESSSVLLCLMVFAHIWNLCSFLCLWLIHLELLFNPHEPHICWFVHISLLHVKSTPPVALLLFGLILSYFRSTQDWDGCHGSFKVKPGWAKLDNCWAKLELNPARFSLVHLHS